jgi:hypothetical protein
VRTSKAAGLVGVPAEVVDQVLAGLGDVLGELGDEVRRVEERIGALILGFGAERPWNRPCPGPFRLGMGGDGRL